MTSQPGKQAISTHALPNISRSKGNKTMKFGQLIEYSMRNIFPQKPLQHAEAKILQKNNTRACSK